MKQGTPRGILVPAFFVVVMQMLAAVQRAAKSRCAKLLVQVRKHWTCWSKTDVHRCTTNAFPASNPKKTSYLLKRGHICWQFLFGGLVEKC